jgi:Ca2+-binding EF-hand superfamily protein
VASAPPRLAGGAPRAAPQLTPGGKGKLSSVVPELFLTTPVKLTPSSKPTLHSQAPAPSSTSAGTTPTKAFTPRTLNAKKAQLKKGLAAHLMHFTKSFGRWDTSGNGTIDRAEFHTAMRAMNLPGAEDEQTCELVFADVDVDDSGGITHHECLRYALLDVLQGQVTRVWNLCKLWDADSSGTINRDEFRDVIKAIGLEAPHASVDALFAELDEEREGEISYEELTRRLRVPRGHICKQLAAGAKESKAGGGVGSRLRGATRTVVATRRLSQLTSPRSRDVAAALIARRQNSAPTPPPLRLSAAVLPSSSAPPSPSTVSSDDSDFEREVTPQTPRSVAEAGARLIQEAKRSTWALEVQVAERRAHQARQEAERAQRAEASRRSLPWPGYRRYKVASVYASA